MQAQWKHSNEEDCEANDVSLIPQRQRRMKIQIARQATAEYGAKHSDDMFPGQQASTGKKPQYC